MPFIAAVGAISSIGIGAAGAAGAFNKSAPKARSESDEYKKSLQAQLDVMPQWMNAEMAYRPKFAQLDVDIAKKTLPQVLDLYGQAQPQLARLDADAKRYQVETDMGILQEYAGDAAQAMRSASGNQNLLALLTRDAEASLNGGVDPYLMEQASQQLRAGQAARGMMAAGMPAATAEAVFGAERANAIRAQNRAFAGQVVGWNQASGGDPLMMLLGRPSQSSGNAPAALGASNAYNPGNIFNIQSPYASDLYNTNYNAKAAQTIANQNTQMAAVGGLMSSLGGLSQMGGSFGK